MQSRYDHVNFSIIYIINCLFSKLKFVAIGIVTVITPQWLILFTYLYNYYLAIYDIPIHNIISTVDKTKKIISCYTRNVYFLNLIIKLPIINSSKHYKYINLSYCNCINIYHVIHIDYVQMMMLLLNYHITFKPCTIY